MVAGLAHESRNALQRSQACLSVLQIRLQEQPELVELLTRLQNAQDDLQRLFNDVRTYAAAPRLQLQSCDVRRTWRDAWDDLGASQRSDVVLREEFCEEGAFCLVDPFYLKQVFRNLLENALSCGAEPVRVTIRCQADGDGMQIRVRDNGPGFPPAVRGQLFEPFFTTKLRGTGLGLAICRRIIEAHGGRIEAGDAEQGGAEILLSLPRRAT
jgi:signal transduction histidine kinase